MCSNLFVLRKKYKSKHFNAKPPSAYTSVIDFTSVALLTDMSYNTTKPCCSDRSPVSPSQLKHHGPRESTRGLWDQTIWALPHGDQSWVAAEGMSWDNAWKCPRVPGQGPWSEEARFVHEVLVSAESRLLGASSTTTLQGLLDWLSILNFHLNSEETIKTASGDFCSVFKYVSLTCLGTDMMSPRVSKTTTFFYMRASFR